MTALEDFSFSVERVDLRSCRTDWQCSICHKLNDSAAPQCLGKACQAARPSYVEAMNTELAIKANNILCFVGSGAAEEDVILVAGVDAGTWVPKGQNQLKPWNIDGVEAGFALKVLCVHECDHTAGNMVPIECRTFGQQIFAGREIEVGKIVEIKYTAKMQTQNDTNMTVNIHLMPQQKLRKNGQRVGIASEKITLEAMCDTRDKVNNQLHETLPRLIGLDNRTMGLTKSPSSTIINPKDNFQMHDVLVNYLLEVQGMQDAMQAIKGKEGVSVRSVRLARIVFACLQHQQRVLDVAGLPSSAMDCARAFVDEFPQDGSRGEELLEKISEHANRVFVQERTYVFDRDVQAKVGQCSITGQAVVLLETSPTGEQQRMGNTPNCLRYIQQKREQNYLQLQKSKASVWALNKAWQDICDQPTDCEDGGELHATVMHCVKTALREMQATDSSQQQQHIYDQCLGKAMDRILDNKIYTTTERKEIKAATRFWFENIAQRIGVIHQTSFPSIFVLMAGGAKQDVSQQNQIQNVNQGSVEESEISLQNEEATMQQMFQSCAGHLASGNVQNNKVAESNVYFDQKRAFSIEKHKVTKALNILESTADFYRACDEQDANVYVQQNIYCTNEQDAAQVQMLNSVEALFSRDSTISVRTLGQNNILCAQAWASHATQALASEGNNVNHIPVVTNERADEFYKALINFELEEQKNSNSIPCVTMNTVNKLQQGQGNGYNVMFHRLRIDDKRIAKLLETYVSVIRRVNNAVVEGNNIKNIERQLARLQICGLPVLSRALKIGNIQGINPYSLRCVSLDIKGHVSNDDNSAVKIQKNISRLQKKILQEHEKNLTACSKGEFAAYVQAQTDKSYLLNCSTAIYPEILQNSASKSI